MFGKKNKEILRLKARVKALEVENSALKVQNEELSKKTISQRTTQAEQSPSFAQVVDEWLNGTEEEGNG